ncbi:MAG: ribonuclease HI [Proteobacteria bacterium]|nr:MAG: ribonuclease HI [Pseudomonadota bacterium]
MQMPTARNVIFTDGSSLGNPGPGGYGAILLFCEGICTEFGGSEPHTTSNAMELLGAVVALRAVRQKDQHTAVYSDSSYLVNNANTSLSRWARNGWMTLEGKPIANQEKWQALFEILKDFTKVDFHHVSGHAGLLGNERCDLIARGFAEGKRIQLYSGPTPNHPDAKTINDWFENFAPYYLSFLDGKLLKHTTWPECEARVKAKKGAKFKKIKTKSEEADTLKNWGARF